MKQKLYLLLALILLLGLFAGCDVQNALSEPAEDQNLEQNIPEQNTPEQNTPEPDTKPENSLEDLEPPEMAEDFVSRFNDALKNEDIPVEFVFALEEQYDQDIKRSIYRADIAGSGVSETIDVSVYYAQTLSDPIERIDVWIADNATEQERELHRQISIAAALLCDPYMDQETAEKLYDMEPDLVTHSGIVEKDGIEILYQSGSDDSKESETGYTVDTAYIYKLCQPVDLTHRVCTAYTACIGEDMEELRMYAIHYTTADDVLYSDYRQQTFTVSQLETALNEELAARGIPLTCSFTVVGGTIMAYDIDEFYTHWYVGDEDTKHTGLGLDSNRIDYDISWIPQFRYTAAEGADVSVYTAEWFDKVKRYYRNDFDLDIQTDSLSRDSIARVILLRELDGDTEEAAWRRELLTILIDVLDDKLGIKETYETMVAQGIESVVDGRIMELHNDEFLIIHGGDQSDWSGLLGDPEQLTIQGESTGKMMYDLWRYLEYTASVINLDFDPDVDKFNLVYYPYADHQYYTAAYYGGYIPSKEVDSRYFGLLDQIGQSCRGVYYNTEQPFPVSYEYMIRMVVGLAQLRDTGMTAEEALNWYANDQESVLTYGDWEVSLYAPREISHIICKNVKNGQVICVLERGLSDVESLVSYLTDGANGTLRRILQNGTNE